MMTAPGRSTGVRPVYLVRAGTEGWPCSTRRTMSSPACEAWNFTSSRSPKKRNRRDRLSPAVATATATVPTGLAGVPPSGPAMPVMPTPMSASAIARMPSAMARATGSLTAPWASSRAGGTRSTVVLTSLAYATTPCRT